MFSVGGWGSARRRGSGAGGVLPLLLLMSSMGSAGQWRRSLVRVVRINLAAAIIKLQIAVVVTFVVVVVVVAWHLLLLLSPFVCLVSPRLVSSGPKVAAQLVCLATTSNHTRTSHSIARTCPQYPSLPTLPTLPLETRPCPLLGLIYLRACLSSRILMCFSLSQFVVALIAQNAIEEASEELQEKEQG